MSVLQTIRETLSDSEAAKAQILNEFRSVLAHKAYWFSFIFGGTMVALSGAFDSGLINPLALRLFYYNAMMIVSALGCAMIASIVAVLVGQSVNLRIDLGAVVAFIWITIIVIPHRMMFAFLSGTELTLSVLATAFVQSLSFGFGVLALCYAIKFVGKLGWSRKVESKFLPVVPTPAKDMDLPIYIQSEGHYLKIVREQGVDVIRARLSEAEERYGEYGLRCHKSYWVSRIAIDKRRREGRQMRLVLRDGTELPVGRSYEKSIQEAMEGGSSFPDPKS